MFGRYGRINPCTRKPSPLSTAVGLVYVFSITIRRRPLAGAGPRLAAAARAVMF